MNNIDDLVEIYECPLCGGAGILEEDCGSSYYVTCLECGCHSVNIDFKSDRVVNWLLIYTYDYSIFYLIN